MDLFVQMAMAHWIASSWEKQFEGIQISHQDDKETTLQLVNRP